MEQVLYWTTSKNLSDILLLQSWSSSHVTSTFCRGHFLYSESISRGSTYSAGSFHSSSSRAYKKNFMFAKDYLSECRFPVLAALVRSTRMFDTAFKKLHPQNTPFHHQRPSCFSAQGTNQEKISLISYSSFTFLRVSHKGFQVGLYIPLHNFGVDLTI